MGISIGNINSAIRRRLLSKEDKVKLQKTLFETVQDGDIVEHFMRSPAWLKIISPWLETDIKKAKERWKNSTPEDSEDRGAYIERGRVRLLEDFESMLNEKLQKREVARQKLSELQLTGEKDD